MRASREFRERLCCILSPPPFSVSHHPVSQAPRSLRGRTFTLRDTEKILSRRGSFQSDYAGEPGEPPIIQSRFIAATDKGDYLSLAVFTILSRPAENKRAESSRYFGDFLRSQQAILRYSSCKGKLRSGTVCNIEVKCVTKKRSRVSTK